MFLKFFQAISSDLFERVRFSVELICLSREKHIPFPSLTLSSSCARVVREKKADNFPLHRADTPAPTLLLYYGYFFEFTLMKCLLDAFSYIFFSLFLFATLSPRAVS